MKGNSHAGFGRGSGGGDAPTDLNRASRTIGDDAVTYTILGVGLDDTCRMQYHLTNINLQLSKDSRVLSFAVHPPTS